MGPAVPVIGMSFFDLCFSFHVEDFEYCYVTELFVIGTQKGFDHDWFIFGVFCWNMPQFVLIMSAYTKNFEKCSFLFFLTTSIFSDSLIGILVCSLNMLVPFGPIIL